MVAEDGGWAFQNAANLAEEISNSTSDLADLIEAEEGRSEIVNKILEVRSKLAELQQEINEVAVEPDDVEEVEG